MALLRSLKVSIFTIRVFYLKEKKKKKDNKHASQAESLDEQNPSNLPGARLISTKHS